MKKPVFIGTAAWTLPKEFRFEFEAEGSNLEKYATRLNAVEINTSFYRDHKAATYERWANSVPLGFRFSVKLSKVFSHEHQLNVKRKDLGTNLDGVMALGEKLGCLLVQLPPKLQFSSKVAGLFFERIRHFYEGAVVLEPRHVSWDEKGARKLLKTYKISRVVADPQPYFTRALVEDDFHDVAYFRLHGSPAIYKSSYDVKRLRTYEGEMRELQKVGLSVWCIFDNTTLGCATGNALSLRKRFVEKRSDLVRKKLTRGLGDVQSIRN